MKLFVIFLVLALSGCASLANPQGAAQSVSVIDYKQQIMKTTCSGAVEEWGNCSARARQACANGYEILEKIESPIGGKRELTFKCK